MKFSGKKSENFHRVIINIYFIFIALGGWLVMDINHFEMTTLT